MSKKKKIKRLERENADLRERLKFIDGYFAAANVVMKTFNAEKSTVENITNVFKGGVEINDNKAEM